MKIDGEKKEKNLKIKNVKLFCHFTLEIFNWGVFLPIIKSPKNSTTVPNSVNDTQNFMSIKYKAFMPCKLHPSAQDPCFENKYLNEKRTIDFKTAGIQSVTIKNVMFRTQVKC